MVLLGRIIHLISKLKNAARRVACAMRSVSADRIYGTYIS
jgi:hypothetical protein